MAECAGEMAFQNIAMQIRRLAGMYRVDEVAEMVPCAGEVQDLVVAIVEYRRLTVAV